MEVFTGAFMISIAASQVALVYGLFKIAQIASRNEGLSLAILRELTDSSKSH